MGEDDGHHRERRKDAILLRALLHRYHQVALGAGGGCSLWQTALSSWRRSVGRQAWEETDMFFDARVQCFCHGNRGGLLTPGGRLVHRCAQVNRGDVGHAQSASAGWLFSFFGVPVWASNLKCFLHRGLSLVPSFCW